MTRYQKTKHLESKYAEARYRHQGQREAFNKLTCQITRNLVAELRAKRRLAKAHAASVV